jgi:hypothetical protein
MFMELVTRDLPLSKVTFGLLRGWWRATDLDLRPDYPLLDRAQWTRLLAGSGFRGVAAVSCTEDQDQAEHATFIAFAPAESAAPGEVLPAASPRRYVLFADAQGVAAALGRELQRLGHDCVFVEPGEATANGDSSRPLDIGAPADIAGVVHCCSLDHPTASRMDLEQLEDAQATGLMSAYRLIRAVAEEGTPVWLVTRNVHRVTAQDLAEGLASAPLVGLARVANTELQCRFRLVDLDDCPAERAAGHLLSEITLPSDGEIETAYRDDVRYALRFGLVRPEAFVERTFAGVRPDGSAVPYRLQSDKPGVLTNLVLRETTRATPGPGEIEVRVRAGGINFRDVMKALGTYPGNPVDVHWLGDDFAGVVERVGGGVDAYRPGDEVAGIAPCAFRSYAIADARLTFPKPPHVPLESAATLPTAFLTAHYALDHLARMQPGERILVHAATGGVGQAALQIARRLSLEIFATAGTPEKRALLARMGVRHVMSSRTLEFADQIMDATGGRGVDAGLN